MGRVLLTALMVFAFAGDSLAVMTGRVVVFEVKEAGNVVFDGTVHAKAGLKCDDCHPSLFQMKRGSTEIKMDLIQKHKACGCCHDGSRAFRSSDPENCARCHRETK
jgi:c(7)-type cytochrome triheme protein